MKTSPVDAAFAAGAAWSVYKGKFEIKDQYDVVVDVTPNITISDAETDLTLVDPKQNGTSEVVIKIAGGADTKKKATVKLTFNGSSYVFDQVVTFKSTN